MLKIFSRTVCSLLFFLLTLPHIALFAKAPLWKAGQSDLPSHPKVYWGELQNGIHYAIMPHAEPPNRVSMRLVVQAGSLMEEDNQQGLAHFLEHMAFKGSTHFSSGELIEYLQKMGMHFGADTNAHTSFNETVYKLEIPEVTPQYLKDSFTVLSDYAHGLLLKPEAIESERGVVLAEKRDSDTVDYRIYEQFWKFMLEGTLLPKRFPIGQTEVIQNAPRDRFVEFYEKWYTCDRMFIVVVGDVEIPTIQHYIEEYFSDIPPNPTPTPDPDLGSLSNRGILTQVHYEAEAANTSVEILSVKPYTHSTYNKEDWLRDLYESLANQILSRRLDILSKEEGAPFISGGAYSYNYLDFYDFTSISALCLPDKWQSTLESIEQALRKTLDYGFTEAELNEVKARTLYQAKISAQQHESVKSAAYASGISKSIIVNRPFISQEDNYKLTQEALKDVTPEIIHSFFKKSWDTPNRYIYVSGNADIKDPKQTVLAAYKKSYQTPISQPEESQSILFAYTDFGTPGAIAKRSYDQELDIHTITFSNNVVLNIKKTDFEDKSIRLGVRLGSGLLDEPESLRGISYLTGMTFLQGGLQGHSSDELIRIFAGSHTQLTFHVGDDAFLFSGETDMEDLQKELDLLTAYILYPGYRPESLRMALQSIEPIYHDLEHTPEGVFKNQAARFLANGDPRFGFPEKNRIIRYTLEDIKNWLTPYLGAAFIEISLVGDLEVEPAIQAVGKTLGTLPKRAPQNPPHLQERNVHFPTQTKRVEFPYKTALPKAMAATAWPTTDFGKIHTTRRLNVLASIYSDAMVDQLRKEQGQTYSPYAFNNADITFPHYGYFVGIATADPKDAAFLNKGMLQIAEKMCTEGISEEQFSRAINPIRESLKEYVRNNGYWLNQVLMGSQEYPEQLNWARTLIQDYNSITIDEVNSIARKYLDPKNGLRILITPMEQEKGKDL